MFGSDFTYKRTRQKHTMWVSVYPPGDSQAFLLLGNNALRLTAPGPTRSRERKCSVPPPEDVAYLSRSRLDTSVELTVDKGSIYVTRGSLLKFQKYHKIRPTERCFSNVLFNTRDSLVCLTVLYLLSSVMLKDSSSANNGKSRDQKPLCALYASEQPS